MIENTARLYEAYIGEARCAGCRRDAARPAENVRAAVQSDKGKNDFILGPRGPRTGRSFKAGASLKAFGGQSGRARKWRQSGAAALARQGTAVFRLIDGIEIRTSSLRSDGRKQVSIDAISLNWDQLIGSIRRARISSRR
jgi:hypothetical protein